MASGSSGSQPEEVCLVCNDISTGYHYGIPSCNGCKTFFRRTIMKSQKFTCQYEGKCPVDKSIRCACRHCRFEKCLQVGMDRNAIQQNRDPIGYTKRTRRYPPIKKMDGSEESSPKPSMHTPPNPAEELEDNFLSYLAAMEANATQLRLSAYTSPDALLEAVCAPCLLTDEQFMHNNPSPAEHHRMKELYYATNADFHYWHERDWMVMIEWAKSIPAYQRLPLNDKLALLRHSAITYPSLIHTFYSPDNGPDMLVFPTGAYFDRHPDPARPLGFNKKKYQMLDQLLSLRTYDATEFAAFKAIFFLNPDADDVDALSKAGLCEGRNSITNALYRYMVRKKGTEEAGDRFGRLLLHGTILATMAVEMKEAVLVADFFEQVRFTNFAKQLMFGIKEEVVV